MVDDHSNPRTELAAAHLAIEWKHLFATELKSAAEQIAEGSAVITADHYCQALPVAVSAIARAVKMQTDESANARRKIA